jgi:uncharacterized protein (TIGR02996 family)
VTDRDALLAAVLENPADDTARLVLADYLEENGEPDLGRFLRAGVVASRYRTATVIEDREFYGALAELSAVAESGAPARWLAALGLGPSPLTARDWGWDNVSDLVTVRLGRVTGEFARGMLVGLSVRLGEWLDVCGRAVARWPVERVTVSDLPGLSFWIDPPDDDSPGWRLTAALTAQPRRPGPRGLLAGLTRLLGPRPPEVPPADPLRWSFDVSFPDRPALVAGVAAASARLVDRLKDQAAGWWPAPR